MEPIAVQPPVRRYSLAVFRRKSPFMTRVREQMRMLHLSIRTEDAYCHWISSFLEWTGWKAPEATMGEDVTGYLTYLAVNQKVSASTQNQAFNALLFLFRRVLDKELGEIKAKRAPAPQNVPEFYTKDEIKDILAHLPDEHELLARLAYGTGMRLMELLRLRVKDVDFGNGLIVVRRGKGEKDRVVPLPQTLAPRLRKQVDAARALHAQDLLKGFGEVWLPDALARKYDPKDWRWQYVFPSRRICKDPRDGKLRRHHLFETAFQQMLCKAGKKAGMSKRVHAHAFRHSFATHLLQSGHDIIQVQKLLGHADVRTTMIYTHCRDNSSVRSPVDSL